MPRKQKQTPEEAERYRTGQTNAKGQPICGGKTKKGTPCKETRLYPNGRCRKHGGPTPNGPASPHYKTGKWSDYAPEHLIDRYQQWRSDPQLLNLSDDIALTDARISDLLSRVDTGESGAMWKVLRRLNAEAIAALRSGSAAEAAYALTELNRLINAASQDYAMWSEIIGLMDSKRKGVESQRRAMVEAKLMLSVDQAVMFADALLEAVRNNVSDVETLSAISTEFNSILSRENQHRLDEYTAT